MVRPSGFPGYRLSIVKAPFVAPETIGFPLREPDPSSTAQCVRSPRENTNTMIFLVSNVARSKNVLTLNPQIQSTPHLAFVFAGLAKGLRISNPRNKSKAPGAQRHSPKRRRNRTSKWAVHVLDCGAVATPLSRVRSCAVVADSSACFRQRYPPLGKLAPAS